MSYSKPMVTIELDEYNELLKLKSDSGNRGNDIEKYVKPYQVAISAIFGHLIFKRVLFQEDIENIKNAVTDQHVIMSVIHVNAEVFNVNCQFKEEIKR